MSSRFLDDDLLVLYAMGELSAEDAAAVRRRLASGELDAAQLAEWQDFVGSVADASVAPATRVPSFDSIRETTRSHGSLEVYVERVASLVDADLRRARRLLRLISDPDAWLDAYPGCRLMHIRPGPAIARPGLDVGFVALEPNIPFPEHTHLGHESVLVLQGTMLDLASGATHHAGSLVEMPADSTHAIQAGPDEPLIYLVVVGGVDIPGQAIPEPSEEWVW